MSKFYERRSRIITSRAWIISLFTLAYMGASWQKYGFTSLGMGFGLICLIGVWLCVELWQANALKAKEYEKPKD